MNIILILLIKTIGGVKIFSKAMSLETSENFFKKLDSKLRNFPSDLVFDLDTFNNNRESGYVLHIFDIRDKGLCVWACNERRSDKIMIVIADDSCKDEKNMFSDSAYEKAKYFRNCDYKSAIDYTINQIRKFFPNKFLNNSHFEFSINKTLDDLEHIKLDAKDLEYEDYYDMATLYIDDYFCDLIIMEGKLGLRYSKYADDDHQEYNNISFEEWEPDLTSDIKLMLGMKDKLEKFIDEEFDYNIDNSIKI